MRVFLEAHQWVYRSRLYRSDVFWLYLQVGHLEATDKVALSGELASRTPIPIPLVGVPIGLLDRGRPLYRTTTDYRGRFALPLVRGAALCLHVLAEAEQSDQVSLAALGLR